MKVKAEDVFSMLARPIVDAAREKGFHSLTAAQLEAIPLILQGKNVLLIAPTASGKTEAAILPVLSAYVTSADRPPGIKILYITPLRALNRDLLERLEYWCSRLDVGIGVRHGDTDLRERGRQAKSPPDVLITTPETLQAILPGRIMKQHLREIRHVIIDEVHELAEDKRGSQLTLALERLRWTAMKDFQVIGLSATIGSPETVGKFLVGAHRSVEIVKVPLARKMRLGIFYPKPAPVDYRLASKLYTNPDVAARLRIMRRLIKDHDSVLLFTNTRSIAEVLASRFRIWDVDCPISIHHGSLAKLARIAAEQGLKGGRLKGLVCTSSLELGIDVGRVDFVIQYMSPRQVTRLIQRVGRSGHRVGRVADGTILTMDSDDTLEAMAISRRAYEENLEPVSIPHQPLDALTHQIVGLLIQRRRWHFNEILDLFKDAYPYRDLNEDQLKKILVYMHSRYPRLAWVSMDDELVLRPNRIKEMYSYYYGKLSMIPDQKQYLVVNRKDDAAIGVLDEAFVAEYGEPGTKFIIRGSPWRMMGIRSDKIYVEPTDDPTGAIPSWVGEEIPVPFDVALEVGRIRADAASIYREQKDRSTVATRLSEQYRVDYQVVLSALQETLDQVDDGYEIPSDRVITVETWDDFVIVCASFGTLVNRTLAQLIGHVLSEETGSTVGVQYDAYRIVVQSPEEAGNNRIVKILNELPKTDICQLISKASMKTGLFRRRMVHVARRFGAVSKWADFSTLTLNQLMKSFEGTVIIDEAMKETLEKDLDLDNTKRILQEIEKGEAKVVQVKTEGSATRIAQIGLERISRRTDLITPERMKRMLLESIKVRLQNEVKTVACMTCREFSNMMRIKDLPQGAECPECGSNHIALLNNPKEEVMKVFLKKGVHSSKEKRILDNARQTATLMRRHGKAAAYVLAGRGIRVEDASRILKREKNISDGLFELIMEAEKIALRRRFW